MALLSEKYILDDMKAVFPLISRKMLDFQMDQYFVTNEKNVYFYRKGETKTQHILSYFRVLHLILFLQSYKIKIHEINHTKPNIKVVNN